MVLKVLPYGFVLECEVAVSFKESWELDIWSVEGDSLVVPV